MTGGVRNVFSFQLELANVGWLNLAVAVKSLRTRDTSWLAYIECDVKSFSGREWLLGRSYKKCYTISVYEWFGGADLWADSGKTLSCVISGSTLRFQFALTFNKVGITCWKKSYIRTMYLMATGSADKHQISLKHETNQKQMSTGTWSNRIFHVHRWHVGELCMTGWVVCFCCGSPLLPDLARAKRSSPVGKIR